MKGVCLVAYLDVVEGPICMLSHQIQTPPRLRIGSRPSSFRVSRLCLPGLSSAADSDHQLETLNPYQLPPTSPLSTDITGFNFSYANSSLYPFPDHGR